MQTSLTEDQRYCSPRKRLSVSPAAWTTIHRGRRWHCGPDRL